MFFVSKNHQQKKNKCTKTAPKPQGGLVCFWGGGWDGTPPKKWGGGTTPNVGVEKCRIWGAVPLRGAPILGCRAQRFGAKKADFGAAGSRLGDDFFWGGVSQFRGGHCPILGGKVLFLVKKSRFWGCGPFKKRGSHPQGCRLQFLGQKSPILGVPCSEGGGRT